MNNTIKTIYLYIFALLGLVLTIIGGVRLVDMALKAFVFTQAEQEEKMYYGYAPAPVPFERISGIKDVDMEVWEISEEEKAILKEWIEDYKNRREMESSIDFVTARRHRNASMSISMILIGLPLYLYHWKIIAKEGRKS